MGVARELRDGGTLGREGREGGTWRREGGSAGPMERERERSLGRDGSLGRHCDLRGAELVQVAERQLSQIQHVHGYVTHTHITPPQVTHSGWLSLWLYISMHTNTYMWHAHHTDTVNLFLPLSTCFRDTHMAQGEAGVCSLLAVCQSMSKHLCKQMLYIWGQMFLLFYETLSWFLCFDNELINFAVYSCMIKRL